MAQNSFDLRIPAPGIRDTRNVDIAVPKTSSADPLMPTQDEIEQTVEQNLDGFQKWFDSQQENLGIFLGGTAGILIAGILLALLTRTIIRRKQAHADAQHQRLSVRWHLMATLYLPLICFMITLGIFFFLLPILDSLPDVIYPFDMRIFFTVLTLIAVWGIFRMLEVFNCILTKVAARKDNDLDDLIVSIIRKTAKIVIGTFTVLFIGQSIFHLNIGTILTSAGAVGLGIAFIAKESLTNFLGAIIIILDKPFRIGDRIRFNNIDGIVKEVGMRSCRILTKSESLICVPNSTITDSSIENVSAHGHLKLVFSLGLVYTATPEQLQNAVRILHGIVDDFHGPDSERFKPVISIHDFGNSSINIEVILWLKTDSFLEEDHCLSEINLKILQEFNKANLEMAYNTTTNYLRFSGPVEIRTTPGS